MTDIMILAFIGDIEGALLILCSLIFKLICFITKNKNHSELIKAIFNVGAIMSCVSTIIASVLFLIYILFYI